MLVIYLSIILMFIKTGFSLNQQCYESEHTESYLQTFALNKKSYCDNSITCLHRKFEYPESFCHSQDIKINKSIFKEYIIGNSYNRDLYDDYYIKNI